MNNKTDKYNEVVDLNSFASRKTAMGGALGMGLFASNIDQCVSLATSDNWNTLAYIKLTLLILSIATQVKCNFTSFLGFVGYSTK